MTKECIDRLINIMISINGKNVAILLQIFYQQQNDSIIVISMLCKLKKKYIYKYVFNTLNDGVILIQN